MIKNGYIEAICVSTGKGTVKIPIDEAEFVAGHGIKDDAHAGNWHRQVSLLAGESIDRLKKQIPELRQGAFAENIITRNLDFKYAVVGYTIRIGGDILLKITQIGKECHHGCAIKQQTGECIMPTEGIFAKVLHGGIAKPGDSIELITE
ncbi:MOSC domain-containing protein [candidate division KSB1 bacterium]|nr:MOSC domain-containing protein [candidate division KSB1 bacterium]